MSSSPTKEQPDQRDTVLAKAALDAGLITQEQLRQALARQSELALETQGDPPPLGLVLLSKRFLKNDQLVRLTEQVRSGAPPEPGSAAPASVKPFGKYSILGELGRGAMAVVYEAADTQLERPVALKVVLPNPSVPPDQAARDEKRFLQEAKLTAGLPKHPHIVGVYEAGAIDGQRYIAMELIRGRQMDAWSDGAPLRRRVKLLTLIAHAVHHAHQHGVIHRDLKPPNILVDKHDQPHITDFGLGKALRQDSQLSLTGDFAVGTPHYMSPEQAQGLKSVDARTDVYSLGVMLYESLCDQRPFDGETPMEVMMKALRRTPAPPSSVSHSKVPGALDAICLKAMARDRRDRYPDTRSFAQALEKWLAGEQVTLAPPRSTRRLQPAKSRSGMKPLIVIGALAGVLGLALLAALLSTDSTPVQPPPVSDDTRERERLLAERREAEQRAARAEAKLANYTRAVTVPVSSRSAWTDTGLDLRPGEYVAFESRDTWTMRVDGPPVGAEGDASPSRPQYAKDFPIPSASCMALVGRMGLEGIPFLAAPGDPIPVPTGGRLYLGPNDFKLDDNSGGLAVTLARRIDPPGPGTSAPIAVNLSGFRAPRMKFFSVKDMMQVREKGTIEADVSVPWTGRYTFIVQASCQPAYNVGAEFVVRVEGRRVGSAIRTSKTPREYLLTTDLRAGMRRIEIEFTNDVSDRAKKIDRNLFIHRLAFRRDG